MGLDMYAYSTETKPISEVDFPSDENSEEFFYWRKHNALHGWMESLYESKGGTETFNLTNLQLTIEDITALELSIMNADLPKTEGFFFGSDSTIEYENSQQVEDLEFIKQAKAVLADGEYVYYSCWW